MIHHKTRRALLFSLALTAIIVGVFALAYVTATAANKFSFVGRGIIQENNTVNGTLKITFTHMSKKAASLALGKIVDVRVDQATILKPNAAGKLVKIKQGNLAVGEEVSARGNVRTDDTFVASKIVVRDRSFRIRGKLLSFDNSKKRMTVEVGSSTYKPRTYNGTVVTIQFTSGTLFMHLGATKKASKITADYQKVQVEGRIVGEDTFEATKMYEPIF